MGRKLEDIKRLRERISSGQLSGDDAKLERQKLKSRIIGTLLQDARLAAGKSTVDSAMMLGITKQRYETFETGEVPPTLPQLEILAYYYNVPINHFWNGETRQIERQEDAVRERIPELMLLRQRILGVRLRQMREERQMTVQDLAAETGIDGEHIDAIEDGEKSPSIVDLELLTQALRAGLDDMIDAHGPVGNWIKAQDDFEAFAKLPPELRAFITRPINRSYLDLAIRLSEMEVNKLRTIAESILDITL